MSETTAAPQGEAASTPVEPAVTPTETPAPVDTGAATETTDETPAPKANPTERRIASLSARLMAAEQERARLVGENETYRRQANPEPPKPVTVDDIPRLVSEGVAAEVQRQREQARTQSFHDAGMAAYPDWIERCQSLMQMGADAGFAELLVEMPHGEGAKVAAALSDDPDELERIAGLKTERGRAIALGRYSAELATRPVPVPTRTVSQAPAPIRPLQGGTARPALNEATATPAQLVELYSKQAMAKRGL